MINNLDWDCFVCDILDKNLEFYLFGAGMLYKKIIPNIEKEVICVLDNKADTIIPVGKVRIEKPEIILDSESDVINILNFTNPYKRYQDTICELNKQFAEYPKCINLYSLPINEIRKTATLIWRDSELLIDNLDCIKKSYNRPCISEAYRGIAEFGEDYLKQLYEMPAGYVWDGIRIGLEDFSNDYIECKEGRKCTLGVYEHRENNIWLFGDSRVSGLFNSNKTTISTFLQYNLNLEEGKFNVINAGIPGREIERMLYQIDNEPIRKGDIVVLLSGFHEYENAEINIGVWCAILEMAANSVEQRGARFMYINLPTLFEMNNLSELECDLLRLFNSTEFKEYNILQINNCKQKILSFCKKQLIEAYDFSVLFNIKRNEYGHCFINLHHYGPRGHKLIADELNQIVKNTNTIKFSRRANINFDSTVRDAAKCRIKKIEETVAKMKNEYQAIQDYILEVKSLCFGKITDGDSIGAIVMNANPFSLGHKYLVDVALKKVDKLIVFVVSEDDSFFSYNERYDMVYRNLSEYERVIIVPSGNYCISKYTFPEYFKKEDIQGVSISADRDLRLFGKYIAPALEIKIRFVGIEPTDLITQQYNNQMKKILKEYGLQVVEVERLANEKGIITATIIRKLFANGNWEELLEYVPDSTLQYLKQLKNKRPFEMMNDKSTPPHREKNAYYHENG